MMVKDTNNFIMVNINSYIEEEENEEIIRQKAYQNDMKVEENYANDNINENETENNNEEEEENEEMDEQIKESSEENKMNNNKLIV